MERGGGWCGRRGRGGGGRGEASIGVICGRSSGHRLLSVLPLLATDPDRQGPIGPLRLAGPRDEDWLRRCVPSLALQIFPYRRWQAIPWTSTRCTRTKNWIANRGPRWKEKASTTLFTQPHLLSPFLKFFDTCDGFDSKTYHPRADPGLRRHTWANSLRKSSSRRA